MNRIIEGYNLYDTFAKKQKRRVGNDWMVCYDKRIFQIDEEIIRVRKKDTFLVCKSLDGSISIASHGQKLSCRQILKKGENSPQQIIQKDRLIQHKPAKNHP